MNAEKPQVLIIGAGPTGLVLALWLTRLGIEVRIIDKTKEAGTTSRALVVHARTFEFYDQMGIAEAVLSQGLKFIAINLWVKSKKAARVYLGEIGEGLSPFPYLVVFPQDEHERLLIRHLREAGVEIERETELLSFTQGDGVSAKLKLPNGQIETVQTLYLAGCDGAHSRVREGVGTRFLGSTYSHLFYVADASANGSVTDKELHVSLDTDDLFFAFPLKGKDRVRLIGTIDENAVLKSEFEKNKVLNWSDVSHAALDKMKIKVDEVNWFSTYHVHHRVAEHFRFEKVFLLGDAAHIHSPIGGQGMNTGIGDAVNLAWKLAEVLKGKSESKILDTYESERIAFARRLVATTDRAFTAATSKTVFAKWIRMKVLPILLPVLAHFRFVRRFMFRTISQIAIRYRESALSKGSMGKIHAGDRLPWISLSLDQDGVKDNFSGLKSFEWQVHFYGEILPQQRMAAESLKISLHIYSWRRSMKKAGLRQKTAYLIRPDGYIGSISSDIHLCDLASEMHPSMRGDPCSLKIGQMQAFNSQKN